MDSVFRDVRFGLKQLVRAPAFALVVLLTLGVCMGANVAIFSVVERVLLRPLPYADADRLVTIFNSYPGAGVERASNAGVDYFLRRERIEVLEEVAAFQGGGATVGDAGSTDRVETMRVTASFFPLLGVEPAFGRSFTDEEMEPEQSQKVMLTHGYWQERYGGVDVVGQDLRVDGRPFTIVGVLPERFRVVGRPEVRFFVPIPFTERERTLDSWHNNNFQMMGRLRPGATPEEARARIAALNASLVDESPIPNARQLLDDAGFHTVVVPAHDDLLRDVRPLLFLLWAGVGFVLLIGCVNVANLMLARSHVRLGELATRLALGARRERVARQILTEAVVVAVLGGGLGVGLGALGIRMLTGVGLDDLPRGGEVAIDGPVLVFTLVLALAAGVLFGMIPVVHVLRSDLSSVFREEGRSGTASRKAVLLRSGLVTSQVALAFLLLVGAGLMFRSFRAAVAVDPGFEAEDLLTASIALPASRYPDGDSRRRFTDELLAEVRALPGVQAASVTSQLPFSGNFSSSVIFPEGREPRPGESLLSPFQTQAGPGYFDAMGIEVLEGRDFQEMDGPDQPNHILIDEWLARRFWPDASPIGELMVYGAPPGAPEIGEDNYYTVIGVVETIKQNDLTAAEHVGAYYFTYRQRPFGGLTLVVRASTGAESVAASVRQVLGRLDPELPLYEVRPMEERVAESLASRRAAMLLLVVFAGVALFLALVGIYGVLAYAVAQRTREVGIRMAMGSPPEAIFRLVLRQGLTVAGLGLVVGGVAALALVRLIRSLLFGVAPADPVVLAGVALLLGAVAALACAVPAWRATRVDPSVALHTG